MIFIKPRKRCEIEIQAELYLALKCANYNAYLEYKVNGCRFDCIIVYNNEIKAIIEVKSKKIAVPKYNGKQFKKYSSFGIPLFYCINSIDGVFEWLSKLEESTTLR